MKKTTSAFTLLELLLALGIIGILVSLIVPTYAHNLRTAHRQEAETKLQLLASRLEAYYAAHNSFADASDQDLGISALNNAHYVFQIQSATEQTFEVKAQPIGSQDADPCGTLMINEQNTHANQAHLSDCW